MRLGFFNFFRTVANLAQYRSFGLLPGSLRRQLILKGIKDEFCRDRAYCLLNCGQKEVTFKGKLPKQLIFI